MSMWQNIFGDLDEDTRNIITFSITASLVPIGFLVMVFLSDYIPTIFS